MKVNEMNDRVLVNTYLQSENKDSRDALIIELIDRGFEPHGDDIVFPRCDRKRLRTCALCTKSLWCLSYRVGGLGWECDKRPLSLYTTDYIRF